MNRRSTDYSVYIEAARLMAQREPITNEGGDPARYADVAIAYASKPKWNGMDCSRLPYVKRFYKAMFDWYWSHDDRDDVLALCFMAAMVEAGDA